MLKSNIFFTFLTTAFYSANLTFDTDEIKIYGKFRKECDLLT